MARLRNKPILSNLELMRREKQRIIVRSRWKRRWFNLFESLKLLSKNFVIVGMLAILSISSFIVYRWYGGLMLKDITVVHSSYYDKNAIIVASGLDYQMPLEKINLDQVRQKIARIPGLDESQIKVIRRFPDRIQIELEVMEPVAIDSLNQQWLLRDGREMLNINSRKILPFFSGTKCSNRENLTRFLYELQNHDLEAYRDISEVHCDEDGRAQIEFSSNGLILILNLAQNPMQGFMRFREVMQKHPAELRLFHRFDLADDGFLFAS